jgi:hemolysin activation/secretion protein
LNLRIQIVPVQVNAVNIHDGKYVKARAIRHQLGLKQDKPISPHQLQGRIQRVMDNPDIQLTTKLEPVAFELDDDTLKPAIAKMNVTINNTLPYHLAGYWSNIDQFDYGEHTAGVGLISNNLTGMGDTAAIMPVLDKYAHGVVMHYEVPINAHGTRLKLDSSIIGTQPKTSDFVPYQFRGKGWTLGVGLSHPLVSRPNWRLVADATAELQQVHTIAKNTPVGRIETERENLRDIRLGLQWDHTGDYGSTSIRHELTQGLDVLGGTPNRSDKLPVNHGGTQYTRYMGTFVFEKNLPHGLLGLLNSQVQWSPNKLPSFQQYGAGGTFTGRGYKEVYIPGDSAIFSSAQLNIPAKFIPKTWVYPFTGGTSVRDSLEFLVFTDYAWAKLNDKFTGADPTEHFLSTGVGARLKINQYLTARVDLGIPLLRNPPFSQSPRIHFGIIGALF